MCPSSPLAWLRIAEEIALPLRQVRGAESLAVAVEIGQRGAEADHREFAERRGRHEVERAADARRAAEELTGPIWQTPPMVSEVIKMRFGGEGSEFMGAIFQSELS